ncbi:GM24806 [Drosophila sechellia]|uniref:GM24806 n=1 Tax=Drosophila sechellia TaxID=7238 RepID=B4HLV6_DROSE|nr:GM24806 [Drosophila sechellia]
MAIGWMDILGVLFFEMVMFYMMRRRRLAQKSEVASIEAQEKCHRDLFPNLLSRKKLSESENIWIFWGYLLMLNVWIGVTLLMIAGISLQKPELMTLWLIWCSCGLVFDVFLILWWFYELFVGDAIEALTNILISLLTMGQADDRKIGAGSRVDLAAEDQDDLVRECLADLGVQEDLVELEEQEEVELMEEQVGLAVEQSEGDTGGKHDEHDERLRERLCNLSFGQIHTETNGMSFCGVEEAGRMQDPGCGMLRSWSS